jgi:hypothetical protein
MNKKTPPQNPIAVAMVKRHGTTTTRMKDRRNRRPKDARRTREWSTDA